MVAFGGAGPVHAYGVARKLGIRRVICPTGAGVTSAIGLLDRAGRGRPVREPPDGASDNWEFEAMQRLLDALAAQGREVVLRRRRPTKAAITNRYTVDMRHVGQGHEITVALPDLDLPKDGIPAAAAGQLLQALPRALRPHRIGVRRRGHHLAPARQRRQGPGRPPASSAKSPTRSRATGRSISTSSAPTWRRPSTTITSFRSMSR